MNINKENSDLIKKLQKQKELKIKQREQLI